MTRSPFVRFSPLVAVLVFVALLLVNASSDYSSPLDAGFLSETIIRTALLTVLYLMCVAVGFMVKRIIVPKVVDLAVSGVDAAKQFQDRNKVCPFCAETIKHEATVCKHCLRTL